MATLADLNVEILANTSDYVSGLRDAQAKTQSFADKTGSLLGGIGKLAAGGALLGGTIAVGAAAAFARTVDGITDVEQALRPAIERSRIAAESLQVLAEAAKRAGSEDGLEAIVDASQELQLELGLIAAEGDSRALPFLERLGLKAQELQALEPEAAFRAVVEQLQQIPNVADRAVAAEEIFGGVSEKLAGIINLTNAEFAALQTEVENTSNILSSDALESAKVFDQELQNLKASLGAGAQAFAVEMLPALTSVVTFLNTTGLPAFQDLKAFALEPFTAFIKSNVVPAIENLATKLQSVNIDVGNLGEKLVPVVDAFKRFFETLGPILPDLTTFAQNLIPGQSILSRLAEKIFPLLEPHLDNFISFVGDIASNILPLLSSALETASPLLEAISGLFEEIAPFIDNVAGVLADLIDKGLTILSGVIESTVIPAVEKLVEFFEGAIPTAIQFVSDKVEEFSKLFSDFALKGSDDSGKFSEESTSAFQNVADLVRDNLSPAFVELAQFAWPLIQEVWTDSLKPTFEELAAFTRDVIIPSLIQLKDFFIATWETIDVVVIPIVKGLLQTIETAIEIVFGVIRLLLTAIQGDWEGAWKAIQDIGEALMEHITSGVDVFGIDLGAIFSGIKDRVTGIWRGFWSGITGIVSGAVGPILSLIERIETALSNIKIPNISLPNINIPGFQEGVRDFAGGLAVVGEHGPELLNLPRGTDVIPLGGLSSGGGGGMAMAGAGGMGGGLTINVYGDVNDAEAFYRKVNEAREEFQRRGN